MPDSSIPTTIATQRRGVLTGAVLGLCAATLPGFAAASPPEESARDKQLREDFPWLARYAADDARIIASGVRPNVVFMGDSLTERWQRTHPEFFSPRRICRGISGQTTPQMVLRMMQDVIALRPKAVHILAGTNDIAGNTGPMTLEQTRDNIDAMTVLAKAAGIRVMIGSVLPAGAFRWSPDKRPAEPIRALNALLEAVARRRGAIWIDYHQAMTTPAGAMRDGLSTDGVHPLAAGYDIMERVVARDLARFERGAR